LLSRVLHILTILALSVKFPIHSLTPKSALQLQSRNKKKIRGIDFVTRAYNEDMIDY